MDFNPLSISRPELLIDQITSRASSSKFVNGIKVKDTWVTEFLRFYNAAINAKLDYWILS